MEFRSGAGRVMAGILALALLGACDKPVEDFATIQPATGETLQMYSKNINELVKIGKDARLVSYFCSTTLSGPCPADIGERLKLYGFAGEAAGVDLGLSFAKMAADDIDGTVDGTSDDSAFIRGAYRAVFGRDPDDSGGRSSLAFLTETGERRTLVRSMLESTEFKTR